MPTTESVCSRAPQIASGLFDKFSVATPTYYRDPQVDPWIVGEIGGGADRWAVIARWD